MSRRSESGGRGRATLPIFAPASRRAPFPAAEAGYPPRREGAMLQPSGPDELRKPESVRVLLVEDERTCAQIVAQQLERLTGSAAQLASVGTLRDALAELSRGAFDLIIADLNVPDSRGLATLSALSR